MRIQHNIMAMSAYRNYTNNVSAMKKNLEKLSSGYKINRAGDDAAGLAISEKMRAQITGLETAQKNAKDGISLVQTAEGALTEVHDMLNRMVELASMSANGTYDDTTDRAQLQKEMDQLTSEINRIADSANFNGIKLLDGSQDGGGATQIITGSTRILSDATGTGVGDVGKKTILDGGTAQSAVKTVFDMDFTGLAASINGTAGAGGGGGGGTNTPSKVDGTADNAIQVAAGTGGTPAVKQTYTAAISGNATTPLEAGNTITIDGNAYTVVASGTGTSGTNVDVDDLATDADIADFIASKITDADYAVTAATGTITFEANNGGAIGGDGPAAAATHTVAFAQGTGANTPSVTFGTITAGTTGADAVAGTGGKTADASGLTASAIKTAADAANVAADGNVTVKMDATNHKLELYVGTTKLGTSDEAVDGTETDFTIKTDDGTSLGTFKLSAGTADTDITGELDTGLDFTAAVTGGGGAGGAGGGGGGGGAAGDKITCDVSIGDLRLTGVEIANKNAADIVDGVMAKLTDGADADGNVTINGAKYKAVDSGDKITFTLQDTPTKDNIEANFSWAFNSIAGGTITGSHTGGMTVTTAGAVESAAQVANTVFEIKQSDITDGTQITLNGKTVTLAVGANSTTTGSNLVKLTNEEAADLDVALSKISDAFGGKSGNLIVGVNNQTNAHATKGLTVQSDGTGTKYTTKEALASVFSITTKSASTGKGLTLQIGDTADGYNQLKVSIGDMHAKTMGLDSISIADQDGAAKAIDVIKSAINYVSDVRGTLGATQNRLDHTINNLSVMTENIQDAESTIRDVDVAEEMMAYTKNNILIQSAQAMLAQANQVPQGVLQLLQ